MSYSITGTSIVMTRGDTMISYVSIDDNNGRPYIPAEGDKVRFAMKTNYSDPRPLLEKDIPIDTMELILEPDDTKDLNFGNYVYDIQLTTASGVVDTFIPKGRIKITEEVD